MKTSIRLLFVVMMLTLVSACSHLHVDLDSNWRLAHDAHVAVVVEQPPAEVTVAQLKNAVYHLGWQQPGDHGPLDAQLLCRWQRVVDLTDDSEPTQIIKSFHAKIINAQTGQLLGVADYFYADGELDLWPGVEKALAELYNRITVVETVVPVVAEPVVAEPVVAEPVVAEPVVAEPVVAEPVVAEPVVVKQQKTSSGIIYQPSPVEEKVGGSGESVELEEHAPETMETSPWVPRFQGMGLENWGKEDPMME